MSIFSYFKRVDSSEKSSHLPEESDGQDDLVIGSKRKRGRLVIESDDSEDECHKLGVLGTSSENGDKTGDNAKCDRESDSVTKSLETNCLFQKHRDEYKVRNDQVFVHHHLKWLQESDIKDKKGRGITHPNYDSKTVQVPHDYFRKLTPGFQQWWTIKSENFDAVIFFKVGKFYELYHMDAEIGVRELGLVFMKSEFAHCGFPEAGFGRYSDALIQKGHRVARVEQVETPAMMEQRIKKKGAATKSDRVVRRELCSVITKGTRTLDFFNGDTSGSENSFLLAIKEQFIDEGVFKKLYGVCFVDTCVGTFHLGQFKDDHESSNLRTLFAHFPPAHVLCERGGLQAHTKHIIDLIFPSCILDFLVPELEFWSANAALKNLAEGKYFESQTKWPPVLQAMIGDGLRCGADVHSELAVSALGACVWCLKRACIDYSILSLASFEKYEPLMQAKISSNSGLSGQRMVLDDVTLKNLDVISPASQTCTLLQKLDTSVTAFGKRLLRQWVCSPLTSIPEIEARQDAIEQLLKHPELMADAKEILRKLPDLERLLRKVHTQGCRAKMKDHPDSRAIFFEHVMYSKRKIADFVSVLDGLRMSLKILQLPQQSLESTLLIKILSTGGEFPDLEEQLAYFENSFDPMLAKSDGVIIPHKGVNQEYDASQMSVNDILNELDQYLKEQRRKLGCKSVVYWGSGRNRFQLEVPVSVSVMQEYELVSQKKGFRRYRTPVIEALLKKLSSAEDSRDKSLRDTMENLFHLFDQHFVLWERAVKCLAALDALLCLATYSLSAAEQMCRPVFVESDAPVLEIVAGQHPLIMHTRDGAEFIPNDVSIEDLCCLMITGPNMGGKSTLMRQTGLLVVLAQLGCYIPSEKCKLSPVDRIFTRMGASDKIIAKESTFFVELKETCSILQHATIHSLVLVDELGRGTATYDGAAIASAVMQQLAEVIKCRTLFSTHYHFLVDQSCLSHNVSLWHMACAVDGEEEEQITFLYLLKRGACPKSYGFNVARLAGLPPVIISSAKKRAISCEQEAHRVALLRKMMVPSIDIHHLRCMAIANGHTVDPQGLTL